MTALERNDPEVAGLINAERQREEQTLDLIASENYAPPAVLEAQGSILTNKYAEGYPGRRYYGGCQWVDRVESLAIERAKRLFGAEYANVQPHAGSQANMAVYYAALESGDTVLGMSLAAGGHLTHGARVNFSGRFYHAVFYGVERATETIDYEAVRRAALEGRPKLIVAGASAYPRLLDFAAFRAIADEVGARLMVDMAHIAGPIAAALHPDPVPVADYVTSSTHKTLRGPRSGFILCKQQYAKAIDSAVFPGLQGGPLEHVIAAKAVCFKMAMSAEFRAYQQQVLANARTLAAELAARGFRLVAGGTDTHMVLVDLTPQSITGKEAQGWLEEVDVIVNKNAIPFDPRPPTVTSGIRLGTPAATTRGMREAEMREIAEIIGRVLERPRDEGVRRWAQQQVRGLCAAFPVYATKARQAGRRG